VTLKHRLGIAAGIGVVVSAVVVYELGPSPATSASVMLGGRTIEIRYSAPSVRGRQIFGDGGLLSRDPTYPVWRAGANAATTLSTTGDLDVGGLAVPAGSYSLYVLVNDPDAWELIVNRQTGQWGRGYDAEQDLGRVPMRMLRPRTPIETLTYVITARSDADAELRLAWERRIGIVALALR
jgi:hypothetical protein